MTEPAVQPLPGWPTEPPYLPAGHPDAAPTPVPQLGPGMGWGIAADGSRVPVYLPPPAVAPMPVYDPIPAQRTSMALLVASIGLSGTLLELGSWVFFQGVSAADHGLMSLGVVLVGGTGLLFALKSGSGTRIRNFHQGDHSSFRTGR